MQLFIHENICRTLNFKQQNTHSSALMHYKKRTMAKANLVDYFTNGNNS